MARWPQTETDPVFEAEGSSNEEVASAVAAHSADTTGVHGIPDTADLIVEGDARLSDDRDPNPHTHTLSEVIDAGSAAAADTSDFDPAGAADQVKSDLLGGAPAAALDTLKELADALLADDSDIGALTTAIAGKQASSAVLTALAALSPTTFGKSVLEWANAAAGISALGLGTAATHAHGDYDAAGSAAAVAANLVTEQNTRAGADSAEAAARVAQLGLPLGLTGATVATRYVGGSSGAPTSGTFAVGDFTIDATNGCAWVCTVAGSPGTWTRIGSAGIELGYAEITSNFTTTSTSAVDVTGLSKSVTVGTRPANIDSYTPKLAINLDNGTALMSIQEGATVLQIAQHQSQQAASGVDTEGSSAMLRARKAPSAGSHTYKVTLCVLSGSATATIVAASTQPAFLQIVEV